MDYFERISQFTKTTDVNQVRYRELYQISDRIAKIVSTEWYTEFLRANFETVENLYRKLHSGQITEKEFFIKLNSLHKSKE